MDRIEKLESIVKRMGRRVNQTTTTIVTPHLISKHVAGEVYGDILSMVMFRGKVSKALICFDKRPKTPVHVEVNILSNKEGSSKSYYLESKVSNVGLDLETSDGTLVTVSINPVSAEDEKYKIEQIWLSILWTPHISRAIVDNYMIDSLENASEALLIEGPEDEL